MVQMTSSIRQFTYADIEKLKGIRLTRHALSRMLELKVEPVDVLLCVARAEQSWQQLRNQRLQSVLQRGDIAVVMEPNTKTVITILLRTEEDWEHGKHTTEFIPGKKVPAMS